MRTPILAVTILTAATVAGAQDQPAGFSDGAFPKEWVETISLDPIDFKEVAAEDEQREADGLAPRFAIPFPVDLDPVVTGTWETLPNDSMMWRLRITAEEAAHVNFGFGRFTMPSGGQLQVYATDGSHIVRPFTATDNDAHGELWTPVVLSHDVMIEVVLPADQVDQLELTLTQISYGYRGFGAEENKQGGNKSGACNIDVVCPEGDLWRNEIPAIGVISTGGSLFCTGFMVNNTSNDFRPFFMTADHCGISNSSDASLVVYWNYETSICDGTPDGKLDDFQTGSVHRAHYGPSDFTLVELDDDPDPAWEVSWSGWDATGVDSPTAVAIHHPSADEKRISFEDDPIRTTSYLGNSSPGDGTHFRVRDWDLGTTEPGSSGSPLFDDQHRVIGQLHGGYAACGNDDADWYGKLSVSWTGGGGSGNSLEPWLDAAGTGDLTADTIRASLTVTPSGTVRHEGPAGGPFSNPSTIYTMSNLGAGDIDYQVSLTGQFGILLDGGTTPVSGTLSPGQSAQVEITLGSDIDALPPGRYVESVVFDDTTNGSAQSRGHVVEVGRFMAYQFTLDSDPGWDTEGRWNHGQPTGSGGSSGNPDPTSGYTGNNVYGFNLGGDYRDNLPERYLTTPALDCTGLTNVEVSFWRWLNVETSAYDHAYFRVSNNGTNWTTVWENSGEVTDNSWSQMSFDISAIADNRSTVYLRWVMGSTDSSVVYSGWNVDDIEIWAIGAGSITEYGTGCPGTGGITPSLSGMGIPSPNGSVDLQIEDGQPNGFGALFVSFSQDLSGASCFLVEPPFVLIVPLTLNSNGEAVLPADLPASTPSDLHVYLQFLGADSGGANGYSASNGLDLFLR